MIHENLARVRQRIREAARRADRSPEDIRLVCVTKNATVKQIEEVINCGASDIGENRVADALSKYGQLGEMAGKTRWHMIGHLQTNKVKKALEVFTAVHSLDSLKLVEELERKAAFSGRRIDCFIEVNTSGETSKYGIKPEEALSFVKRASKFTHINIIGLMTMAPFMDEPELSRPYFIRLRELKKVLQAENIQNTGIRELSMGMSQDFEVAVEEGATLVRIGTAIFSV